MSGKSGIVAGGNWLLDKVKIVDTYPHQDGLCNILSESYSNGGSPYNILKDLSFLKADFPLYGLGLVGDDHNGQIILDDCKSSNIDTTYLKTINHAITSYTDVMVVQDTGRRTFFHCRGANAFLDIEHFDSIKHQSFKIFHLGYLLLLDKLDEMGDTGRTRASVLLEQLRASGAKISVDIVSESSDRFQKVIIPSLPYIDYLFVNEYEAGKITGIDLSDGNTVSFDKVKEAATKLISLGVNELVVIHFPEGVIALNKAGVFYEQGSVNMDDDQIVSAVGAGDAFAAGVLYGLHEDWDIKKCLQLGVCAAASSLMHKNCSEGILHEKEAIAFGERRGYRTISLEVE